MRVGELTCCTAVQGLGRGVEGRELQLGRCSREGRVRLASGAASWGKAAGARSGPPSGALRLSASWSMVPPMFTGRVLLGRLELCRLYACHFCVGLCLRRARVDPGAAGRATDSKRGAVPWEGGGGGGGGAMAR
jgi:hypothetical protein